MGPQSLHKRKAAESLPSSSQPAIYMPAEIPVRVAPPPPKKSKDNQGAPCLCDPMVNIFDTDCLDWSSCDNSKPDPLKRRRLKTKRKQGSLANHPEPHPAPEQDDDIHPAEELGDDFHPAAVQDKDTCPAAKQGNDNTCPTAKQGMKPRPVASLPMSITGWLPCPLGKTAAIHAIHLLQ